jgi:hypothetical protein
MYSGVDGLTSINILENGKERTVNARSLFQKLKGKKKASNRSADIEEIVNVSTDDIKILTLNGNVLEYCPIYKATCFNEGVFKLRGDRISVSASLSTIVFKDKLGFTTLDDVYSGDKVKYINQKKELVYDWIVGLSLPMTDADVRFVYNFYTNFCNFIANRVVIGNDLNAE